MAEKESRGLNNLTVKLDLDVSDALTGLKSVQREAKKATQALKELETYYEEDYYKRWNQDGGESINIREIGLNDVPPSYFQREFEKRLRERNHGNGGC